MVFWCPGWGVVVVVGGSSVVVVGGWGVFADSGVVVEGSSGVLVVGGFGVVVVGGSDVSGVVTIDFLARVVCAECIVLIDHAGLTVGLGVGFGGELGEVGDRVIIIWIATLAMYRPLMFFLLARPSSMQTRYSQELINLHCRGL